MEGSFLFYQEIAVPVINLEFTNFWLIYHTVTCRHVLLRAADARRERGGGRLGEVLSMAVNMILVIEILVLMGFLCYLKYKKRK